MRQADGLVLVPRTEYGVPSGNYDGSSETAFTANRQKAVDYYKKLDYTNTLRFTVDDFVGQVIIQASLDKDPGEDTDGDWFDVYTFPTDESSELDGSSAITIDYSYAVDGRFTWMRAKVANFTGGTIESVTLSY